MRRMTFARALLPLALFAALPVHAAEGDVLTIPRATHAPVIDDYVNGVPADAGAVVTEFRQNAPTDGEPISVETRAYVSHDDTHLYVVFVCKDDPKLLRARITRRDNFFGDEGVQLFLDTFHDKQRAFVFSVNPYGVQMDSRLTEGQGYDFNFDTQWTSDGRITSDGYIATFSIPFKSLRFEKGAAQNWGIALNRIIPRTNEFAYWPYITQRKEGFVPQFATAVIDDEISPGRNIQLNPHVSFRDARTLGVNDAGQLDMVHKRDTDVGLDAKIVFKDALALDLTVNPDFSEVESDVPQSIVNQRYEVLFPEKRPFFLENAGFFGTPVNLFFSRRIVDPQYGARLTGRLGRWALGGLAIDDEAPGLLLPQDDPHFGESARIGVARVQRDFGTRSNAGVLLTHRRFDGHENTVSAVDTRIGLNDAWSVSGQAVRSTTSDDNAPDRDGHLYFAQAVRGGFNFSYTGEYTDVSENFETDLGFVPRTDIRQLHQYAEYLWKFPEAKWLVDAGPNLTVDRTWNQAGDLQDWLVDTGFGISGLGQTTFDVDHIESFERYAGIGFRKSSNVLAARTEWWKWLTIGGSVTFGDAINYIPAAGLAPFLGDARQYTLDFTLSPHPQLRIDQNFIRDELRLDGPLADLPGGSNVFRSTLSRTKVNYQFNKYLAAHVIFDYSALDPNTSLIALEHSKRLTGDVLVSYLLKPGTSLYVGYTDRQENVRFYNDPLLGSRFLERTRDLDMHTGKQFFVKFSYLFNF